MLEYRATITIQAPADRIWQILTHAPDYPQWDPSAIRIEGTIAAGQKITAYTKLSPNRAFPVTVTHFEPPHKMVWQGGMPLGLFKGERTFTLAPAGNGAVQFTVQEQFSGLLLPLMKSTIPNLTQTFEQFAAGLKTWAEKG